VLDFWEAAFKSGASENGSNYMLWTLSNEMPHSQRSFALGFVIIIATLATANSNFAALRSLPDISGAYYFVDKPPNAFEDIDWIALFAVDAKGRKVPINGFIRLKDRHRGRFVNFFLISPTLRGHAITFSTKVIRGISYRFEGQFLKLESLENHEIVLKGLLTKFRNGRKVAQFETRYSYSAGD
jgi:hypothetical protein